MSSKLNVESFVAVLKKSGLIEGDRLQRLVSDYTARGGVPDDSPKLADFLVANNAITRWQSEKLLQGKHKGYFLGKYRLLSLLGKGGMSSVYLAEHVLMRRRCALKVLPTKRVNDSSYLARFHREAQAVASLDHPNIVRAYDVDHQVDRDTEIHFLVMEYVEGFSLQELVQKLGNCSFLDTAEYIRQAALGLQNAHEAGMVHRDVKPGNLLVDPNGVVKVLDLGLARFFTGDEGEDALTIRHDEKVLGTADYLAPEQALDSHTVDARADIYGLGCTMYFVLTGRPPFTEGTLAQRLMAHQTKTPPTIESLRPETPPSLANIVRKMMAKRPEDRYPTAKETADALFAWIDANADSEWRNSHSGIFGTRSTDSAADRANIPVAKPIVAMPVASPVPAPIPPPVVAAAVVSTPAAQFILPPVRQAPDTTPAVDPELSNFFATLSDSEKIAAPKTIAKPAPAAPKSAPRHPVSTPVAVTVPTPPAPNATPAASANYKPPSSKKLKRPESAPVEFSFPSTFPDFEAVTAAAPQPPIAKTPKPSSTTTPQLPKKPFPFKLPATFKILSTFKLPATFKLPFTFERLSTPILAGIGGGVFLLLLVFVYCMGWFGGGSSKKADPASHFVWTADKREITVGKTGDFKTIVDALKAVRRNFDPGESTSDQMVIKIAAGTYRENISIDGTFKLARRRDKKSDQPTEPNWPQGIKLLADGEVVMEPEKPDAPVIHLKNISRFVIEGIDVKTSHSVAVEVAGVMNESRLVSMKISGFTQTGVECASACGTSFGNSQFTLDKLTLEPASGSKAAIGIRMTGADDGETSDAIIRGCRFIGPMSAGVSVAGTGPFRVINRIVISENIFSKTQDGIRFEGSVQWRDNSVLNNTFFEGRHGILFTHMPAEGSRGLSFRRNLFFKVTAAEGTVQNGYDQARFATLLSPAPPGLEFNYSDRPKPSTPGSTEISMFCDQNGKMGETGFAFASTDATDKKYLAPTSNSVQRNVPGAVEGEKNWVGALGLQ